MNAIVTTAATSVVKVESNRWQQVFCFVSIAICLFAVSRGLAEEPNVAGLPTLTVKHCDDFQVSGKGDAEAWNLADWTTLARRPNAKHDYTARFKMLYSATGVYVLSGTESRANFYRVDYDDQQVTGWDWSRVGPSFHEFAKFGTLVFE